MKKWIVSEKYQIKVQLTDVGDDLCVLLTGGDTPHIGAVSAGVYGPGIGAAHMTSEEEEALKEPVHTYAYPSHRDHAMSEPLAKSLSQKLRKNVVVLCGIHIDHLPQEEIMEIVNLLPVIEEEIISNCD